MKKKIIYISMAAFLAITTFSACSNDVEDSIPVPAQEEETVINDNPYAVTIDEAEKTLEQILANENEQITKGGGVAHQRRIKSRYTTGGNSTVTRSASGEEIVEEHPVVHIFNFENNEGFAVMGGDKRGAPMLALTESGELTPGMTIDNPGVVISLALAEAAYRQMIIESGIDTTYITNGVVVSAIVRDSLTVNKNGQCQVNWDQNDPFNLLCPGFAPAGCDAVAVAQLMSIYKYPSSYGGYSFDWDEMLVNNESLDIARLMKQLGLPENLDIQYSSSGSGAYLSNAPRTFQNFGYSSPGTYASYNATTIMNNVMTGKPVLIGGQKTRYIYMLNPLNTMVFVGCEFKGHAWLGDGGKIITTTTHVYNLQTGAYTVLGPTTNKYIHCNFGWKGRFNGLYLCDNIDAPDTTSGPHIISGNTYYYADDNYFQYSLEMVTGISNQ